MDDKTIKVLDRLEAKFDKIEEKIDLVENHLDSINVTLVRNTSSLEEHIRRTELLEKKLEPIEIHVTQMQGAFKFIGVVAVVAGLVLTLMQIYGN